LGPHGQKKIKARNPAAHHKIGNQVGQVAHLVLENQVQGRRVKEDARHMASPITVVIKGAINVVTEKEGVVKETGTREATDGILIRTADRTKAKSP
jgi:hypothetical protein